MKWDSHQGGGLKHRH